MPRQQINIHRFVTHREHKRAHTEYRSPEDNLDVTTAHDMSLAFIPSLRPLRVASSRGVRVDKEITAGTKKPQFNTSSSRYSGSHHGKTKSDAAPETKTKIPKRYAHSGRYHVGYEVSRPDVDMIHDKGMHEFVAHSSAPAVSPPFRSKSFASSSRYGGSRVGLKSSRSEKKRVDEAKRYAWARRDQEEALKELKINKAGASVSSNIKAARVTKYVGANPHHDKYFDWEKEDQRLNIVNEVIERHLVDADEECQVNWIRGMFSGGHETECVRDVDAIMSIIAKHADVDEAVAVVSELVDRGGNSAADAVRTWCAAHGDLPNAAALSGVLDDVSNGRSIGTPSN